MKKTKITTKPIKTKDVLVCLNSGYRALTLEDRISGNFRGLGFYLPDEVGWNIVRDSEKCSVLVAYPVEKRK
jgi:hypothetical protein